ncbi:hypothetical protein F441_15726 [Phytophthora nicotianae CJ01A1]|uniref:Uncharacterized protein n=1 Tax=Phytophthora nicotianae CJ01A1 TaxID=1317063 RepID=W2WCE4_PHYNI|nr:hypothetical protein F441_15726 [Phytophthora nicotianae CJ01A1]
MGALVAMLMIWSAAMSVVQEMNVLWSDVSVLSVHVAALV